MTAYDEARPTAAFTLSAIGLAFQALGGLMLFYFFPYQTSYGPVFGVMGPWMMFGGPWFYGPFSYWFPFFAVLAGAEVVLGVLGVLWMNGRSPSRVRTGSALVLVASIIAFPTMWGFMIGSLLMFVGSILGLSWQPQIRSSESLQ